MKLQFVWVGKTRNSAIKELVGDYLERVKKFARVEVVELRERDNAGMDSRKVVEKEGEEILSRLDGDAYVVALDVEGRALDSFAFADFFKRHQDKGMKQLTFVIGGYAGLSEAVKARADLTLSLSPMTLTHELARVFLVEQVYRAFAILHRLPYQK